VFATTYGAIPKTVSVVPSIHNQQWYSILGMLGLGLAFGPEISALALVVLVLALTLRPWPYSITRPRPRPGPRQTYTNEPQYHSMFLT